MPYFDIPLWLWACSYIPIYDKFQCVQFCSWIPCGNCISYNQPGHELLLLFHFIFSYHIIAAMWSLNTVVYSSFTSIHHRFLRMLCNNTRWPQELSYQGELPNICCTTKFPYLSGGCIMPGCWTRSPVDQITDPWLTVLALVQGHLGGEMTCSLQNAY